MPQPVFETGLPRPQRGVLTTILLRPGDMGYRSPHLSHAKRALYHLSYIPLSGVQIHFFLITRLNTRSKITYYLKQLATFLVFSSNVFIRKSYLPLLIFWLYIKLEVELTKQMLRIYLK